MLGTMFFWHLKLKTGYMDFSIPVVSLIWFDHIQDVVFTHTQRNMDKVINLIYILLCICAGYWCLFFTAQTAEIFKAKKNYTTVAYSGMATIKSKHQVAHTDKVLSRILESGLHSQTKKTVYLLYVKSQS